MPDERIMGQAVVVLRDVKYEVTGDKSAKVSAPWPIGEITMSSWPKGMPTPTELEDAVVAVRQATGHDLAAALLRIAALADQIVRAREQSS